MELLKNKEKCNDIKIIVVSHVVFFNANSSPITFSGLSKKGGEKWASTTDITVEKNLESVKNTSCQVLQTKWTKSTQSLRNLSTASFSLRKRITCFPSKEKF